MKFIDSFWSTDFTSTAGFDALLKRMKDGRQTCKDLEELFKSRAKAEETYGKELVRCAKKAGNSQETGTIKDSWEVLIRHTEDIGNMHITMATALQEEAKKLENFRENQKKKRQQHEESIMKYQSYKKDCYNKTMSSKKSYEAKCKEADSLDEQFSKANQSLTQQKDIDKLLQKKNKARNLADQSDSTYKASIETTENARKMWQKEMEICCEVYQALEEDRIQFLRNTMWIFTNQSSLSCCEDDKLYEEVRKSLENCSVEKDIAAFIQQKRIGNIKPAAIEYENYYKNGTGPANNRVAQPSPIRPSKSTISRRPPQPLPQEPSNRTLPAKASSSSSVYSEVITPKPVSPLSINETRENPIYDSIGTTSSKKEDLKRARKNYLAKSAQEISLCEGELVKITETLDANWAMAEIDGRTGRVPIDALEDFDANNATLL